ncbi:hypothetical protein ES707_11588 [subsurface metagenome]
MNVEAVLESLPELRDVGDLGQQAQFDLRIVGRHQLVAGRGDEGAANLAAVFGAHGDVLQVRLVRRQPARGGRRQRVGRVHAMGLRMHVIRQRIGIGRFQLGNLPPFQNLLREVVALLGEVIEHLCRGRPCAGLGLGAAGKSHLAEDDVAELLRAADIDRLAGELLDFGLDPRRRLGEVARQARQHLAVDRDAAPLHPRQHRDQRPLQRLVDRIHVLRDQPRLQHAPETLDHVGIFGGIFRSLLDRHLVEGQLALAAADQGAIVNHDVIEPARGQRIHGN